ncbi:MAG: response regulator transcription factor [Chloroflexales bacterium]|nr:response regulator transcription factor [Chloroflexales bacterium]
MHDSEQTKTTRLHTVLLVDDDERVSRTLTILLRLSKEWEVVGTAKDETSALAMAAALCPDLILLDLWLPKGNSLGLIPYLRALYPTPLVVILTADPAESLREQALAMGVDGYLDKTMGPDRLLSELHALFGD